MRRACAAEEDGFPSVTTVTVPSVWIPAERRSGRCAEDPLQETATPRHDMEQHNRATSCGYITIILHASHDAVHNATIVKQASARAEPDFGGPDPPCFPSTTMSLQVNANTTKTTTRRARTQWKGATRVLDKLKVAQSAQEPNVLVSHGKTTRKKELCPERTKSDLPHWFKRHTHTHTHTHTRTHTTHILAQSSWSCRMMARAAAGAAGAWREICAMRSGSAAGYRSEIDRTCCHRNENLVGDIWPGPVILSGFSMNVCNKKFGHMAPGGLAWDAPLVRGRATRRSRRLEAAPRGTSCSPARSPDDESHVV